MIDKKNINTKYIISNMSWMLFDKVFILVLNLVVTVQIANFYGKQEYGTYQYAGSVVALFSCLITFVDARVVKKRYISENPEELVWNATITRIIFSFFSLAGGVIYLYLCGEDKEYNYIFLALLIDTIIVNMSFGMQNRYEYLLKSKKVIIASNIALTLGGILKLIAITFCYPILTIVLITVISSCISFFIIYIQYKKEFGRLIKGRVNRHLVKSLVSESLPLAIAACCAVIYSRCDSVMIGNMLSKEDVGIYAIAAKIISIVQIGIAPIRESVYPKMVELYDKDRKQYVSRYVQITAILTWIYIIGVGISFAVLPYAFNFLKAEYSEAFPIYQVYVIGTFFMYNAALRAGHYTLINCGNILMYSQIVSVILNLVLNCFLIKILGIYGAAIATGITQGASLLVSNLFFGKSGKEVFIWQLKGLNPLNIICKS